MEGCKAGKEKTLELKKTDGGILMRADKEGIQDVNLVLSE